MRHPVILPGRKGLPPTSDLPWSANAEKSARANVVFWFIVMWCFIVSAGIVAWYRVWIIAIIALGAAIASYTVLAERRRRLYAMLLNRPRDISQITQWTEHPWPGWSPDQMEFFCLCGRAVNMATAPYFKETKRFSRVCECGRGHFMLYPERFPPPPAPAKIKPIPGFPFPKQKR